MIANTGAGPGRDTTTWSEAPATGSSESRTSRQKPADNTGNGQKSARSVPGGRYRSVSGEADDLFAEPLGLLNPNEMTGVRDDHHLRVSNGIGDHSPLSRPTDHVELADQYQCRTSDVAEQRTHVYPLPEP